MRCEARLYQKQPHRRLTRQNAQIITEAVTPSDPETLVSVLHDVEQS